MSSYLEFVPLSSSSADIGAGFALALGEFDGVHIGHRAILSAAVEAAKASGLVPAVMLFSSPIPTKERRGALCTAKEKLELIAGCGIEYAAVVDFDAVRSMSPERFVSDVLVGEIGCRQAVCGENYRFGHMASGNASALRRCMERSGGRAHIISPITALGGEPVSSTRIRRLIADGECEDAAALLGRAYSVGGVITHGKKLGRAMGTPTLNLPIPDGAVLPRCGVYFTRCDVGTGEAARSFCAVSNVGVRPTVDEGTERAGTVNCESFMLDYPGGELYGERVKVSFLHFRRGEKKFENTDALSAAIKADAEAAREYFAANGGERG